MNEINSPTIVKIHFSDSTATHVQLHAFHLELRRELRRYFPLAKIDVTYEIDVDAPVVAEANGQPSSLLATFVHKVYAHFSSSAVFNASLTY